MNDILTTAQAAKLLGVSIRTAQLWVESGELPSWKTPGGHRRIPRSAVLDLVKRPSHDAGAGAYAVVLAKPDTAKGWLCLTRYGFVVEVFEDTLQAAIAIGEKLPSLVIIEDDCGRERLRLADRLAEDRLLGSTLVVVRTEQTQTLPGGAGVHARRLMLDLRESLESAVATILTQLSDRKPAIHQSQSYPLPFNESDRLKAVEASGLLLSKREVAFDRLIDIALRLFNAPIGMFTLLSASEQWFKAKAGYDGDLTPREWSFCNYTLVANEVTVLEDLAADPRFADNPTIAAPHNFRFYAGAPVRDENGFALGSICIIDRRPRVFGSEDRNALATLAEAATKTVIVRAQERQLRRITSGTFER